jgi:hypothetical protein
MRNNLYYIKAQNGSIPEAIKDSLIKAFILINEKQISNIKLIVSHADILGTPPNYLSDGFGQLPVNSGLDIYRTLKRSRNFTFVDLPKEGVNTGMNVLLSNTFSSNHGNDSVGILVFANEESLKKVQSKLFYSGIDLIAVIQYETDGINEILSACKAENISTLIDPNVIPYVNNFSVDENDILRMLSTINVQNGGSDHVTRRTMQNVIDKLTEIKSTIPFSNFLGYLVNEVHLNLDDSLELLNWKKAYFRR